jgi:hypothetical protein
MTKINIYEVYTNNDYETGYKNTYRIDKPEAKLFTDYRDYNEFEFELPDGYSIGKDEYGKTNIYDSNNNYCRLVNYNNCPAIEASNSNYPLILKAVKSED